MVNVNKQLLKEFKEELENLFKEYNDVFAQDHSELKRVDSVVCQHRIPLVPNARPIKMQRYKMNPSYAKMVKVEIAKGRIHLPSGQSKLALTHCHYAKKEPKIARLCRVPEAQ